MKWSAAWMVTLLVACQPQAAPSPDLSDSALAELEAYDMELLQAMGNGDWDTYIDAMASDAAWMVPNGGWVRGHNEIREFTRQFESVNGIDITSHHVEGSGNLAYRTADYVIRANIVDAEEELVYPGKLLTVYRLQPDGRWLIQTEIWNPSPAS